MDTKSKHKPPTVIASCRALTSHCANTSGFEFHPRTFPSLFYITTPKQWFLILCSMRSSSDSTDSPRTHTTAPVAIQLPGVGQSILDGHILTKATSNEALFGSNAMKSDIGHGSRARGPRRHPGLDIRGQAQKARR